MENGLSLWEKYKWKCGLVLVSIPVAFHLFFLLELVQSYKAYVQTVNAWKWYVLPFPVLSGLVMAQVFRYFRESFRIILLTYLYITGSCILYVVMWQWKIPQMGPAYSLFSLLFSTTCLFKVEAEELTAYCRPLGWLNVILTLTIWLHWTLYWLHARTPIYWVQDYMIFQHFIEIAAYYFYIRMVYNMTRMPADYTTLIDKEIDSIGKMA